MKIAPQDDVAVLDDGAATAAVVTTTSDVPVISDDSAVEKLPAHAVLQDDGSVHLPFKRKVALKFRRASGGEVMEETHASLHLHRLTGADINAINNTSDSKRAAIAIARSARIHAAKMLILFDRMDGADVQAASQVLACFLDSGATTGR